MSEIMMDDDVIRKEVRAAMDAVRAEIASIIPDDAKRDDDTLPQREFRNGIEQALGTIDRHTSDPLPLSVTSHTLAAKARAAAVYIHYLREALAAKDVGSTARPELRPECYEAGRNYYSIVASLDGSEPSEVGL